MPTIDINKATIRTATVEIKTLAVSGKQVTLSVFRQLLNEDLLHCGTGEMLGTPWGLVNYFWGDCKEGSHLHVVWQKGEELRRACVGKIRPWQSNREYESEYTNDLRAYLDGLCRLILCERAMEGLRILKGTEEVAVELNDGCYAVRAASIPGREKGSDCNPSFLFDHLLRRPVPDPAPQMVYDPSARPSQSGHWPKVLESASAITDRLQSERINFSQEVDSHRKVIAKALLRNRDEWMLAGEPLIRLASEARDELRAFKRAADQADKLWAQNYALIAADQADKTPTRLTS